MTNFVASSLCLLVLISTVTSAPAKAEYYDSSQFPYEDFFQPDIVSMLVEGSNNFSTSLLVGSGSPSALQQPGNAVLSPLGVASLLGIMRVCSVGEARHSYNQLPVFQMPDYLVGDAFSILYEGLNGSSYRPQNQAPKAKLNIFNFMLMDRTVPIYQEFFNESAKYNLYSEPADFIRKPQEALKEINEMVNKNTHGLIPKLLHPNDVNSATQLVMGNTVYFQASWKYEFTTPFNRTGSFNLPYDVIVQTRIMFQTARHFHHIVCEPEVYSRHCDNRPIPDLIEMPFKGDDYKMVIIMPNRLVNSLSQIERQFSANIEDWRASTRQSFVTLTMPKFKMNHEINLKEELIKRGFSSAINSRRSSFQAMTPYPLEATKMMHKTSMVVEERGVILASGSGIISILRLSQSRLSQISMNVNRPFLFFIEDVRTRSILFLGRVTDPR